MIMYGNEHIQCHNGPIPLCDNLKKNKTVEVQIMQI